MKKFHHFQEALEIHDVTINRWIKECLAKIEAGETHSTISSGDTSVIALKWNTEIEVIVANRSGKSRISFSLSEGFEDKIEFVPYIRPEVLVET